MPFFSPSLFSRAGSFDRHGYFSVVLSADAGSGVVTVEQEIRETPREFHIGLMQRLD
jgi:hypothetical protein